LIHPIVVLLTILMINKDYKFKEPETTACFVCEHVVNRTRPILLVTHDEDEEYEYWQFLCGEADHDESNIKIISMKRATEIDPAINDVYDMPVGVKADRKSINAKWEPFAINNK
jgi:hypothetical protein